MLFKRFLLQLIGGLFIVGCCLSCSDNRNVDIESLFLNPPKEAKPWVMWFWMNGNVTKEGITADLEAMQKAGIGGTMMMSLGWYAPEGTIDFDSPEWHDLYAHAVAESKRLGLEMILHQCDGYATAGGRWIDPSASIKDLVWRVEDVEGPRKTNVRLEQPECRLDFYEDVAVVAFPQLDPQFLVPEMVKVNGAVNNVLFDNDLTNSICGVETIDISFSQPQKIRSMLFFMNRNEYVHQAQKRAVIAVSEDGETYSQIAEIQFNINLNSVKNKTLHVGFPEVNAKYIRISATSLDGVSLSELSVSANPTINMWEVKATYGRVREHGGETSILDATSTIFPNLPDTLLMPTDRVVDLTDRMQPDGTLDWEIPKGKWRIIRIGMSVTGEHILPPSKGGGGLESDKMDAEVTKFHFDSFAQKIISKYKKQGNSPIIGVHVDSWEAGHHTWSSSFRQEFERRCGYSMIPYLPVLTTGVIVGSLDESERFLWDFRRTLSSLITENFFQVMRDKCHENDLLFESEASGRQIFMYNPIDYQSTADIPMGEFWMNNELRVDCRVAASVAHVYNKPFAGAEAFTSVKGNYSDALFDFKPLADKAFCSGINRFIIHSYVMQPWVNIKPGMCYGPFGSNFNRNNTWWQNGAKVWCDYITRCQALLQTGRFVGDVIYYIGDDVPNFLGHRKDVWNPIPEGYDYDGCNLEILKQLQVDKNGDLVLPHGMRYKVLLLPDREQATMESIEQVSRLVHAGAIAIGKKPIRPSSLVGYPAVDTMFQALVSEIWGDIDGVDVTEHRYGKGRMIYGKSLECVLHEILPVDFSYRTVSQCDTLNYIHRKTGNADIYFVASTNRDEAVDAVLRFRIAGKKPELWDPSTGTMKTCQIFREVDGLTEIPVHLAPAGSVFVVFREVGHSQIAWNGDFIVPKPYDPVITLDGPWLVTFPSGSQAPDSVLMSQLSSWTEFADDGVRYFSGTATYHTNFNWDSEVANGSSIFLDLGKVKNLAVVRLNGQVYDALWKPPFVQNVSDALVVGQNSLEIEVSNLWTNRLIGDEKLHPDPEIEYLPSWFLKKGSVKKIPAWVWKGEDSLVGRTTFLTHWFYDGDEPLLESGLMGPVRLLRKP